MKKIEITRESITTTFIYVAGVIIIILSNYHR